MNITEDEVKHLLDLIMGSLNWESGFYDKEDTDLIISLVDRFGIDLKLQYPTHEKRLPHLWHQDCRLHCGKAADHPLHTTLFREYQAGNISFPSGWNYHERHHESH